MSSVWRKPFDVNIKITALSGAAVVSDTATNPRDTQFEPKLPATTARCFQHHRRRNRKNNWVFAFNLNTDRSHHFKSDRGIEDAYVQNLTVPSRLASDWSVWKSERFFLLETMMTFYHSTQPVSRSQTGQISRTCACASRAKPNVEDTHHDLDGL